MYHLHDYSKTILPINFKFGKSKDIEQQKPNEPLEDFDVLEKIDKDVPNEALTYTKNGIKQDINTFDLEGKTIHRYIGKMHTERNVGHYSNEFLIGTLAYLDKLIPKDGKIVIEIGLPVYQTLGGDMEGILTLEKQKRYIQLLADMYLHLEPDRLEIVGVDQNHQALFSELERDASNPLQGIQVSEKPALDKDNLNSLDIAQYLYRVAQETKKLPAKQNLLAMLKNTIPENERVPIEDDDPLIYYSLVEIATRLMDFLSGITIQGGENRQGLYDQIIFEILGERYRKNKEQYIKQELAVPQLQDLQNICHMIMEDKKFNYETIHLSKGRYDNIIKERSKEAYEQKIKDDAQKAKEATEKAEKKRKKNLIITISLALLSALGGGTYTYHHIKGQQKNEMETTIQDMIRESVQDIHIMNFFEDRYFSYSRDDIQGKTEYINNIVEELAKKAKVRYDIKDKWTLTERKYFIIDNVLQKKVLDEIGQEGWDRTTLYEKLLTKLVADNKFKLVANDIDIVPYHKYREYESYFAEVLNSKKFASLNGGNMDFMKDRDGNIPHDDAEYEKTDVGEYITRGGGRYELAILEKQIRIMYEHGFESVGTGEKHLAASYDAEHLSGITGDDGEIEWTKERWISPFNTFQAKEIAVDYFLTTQADIQTALDNFWEYYGVQEWTGDYGKINNSKKIEQITYRIVQDRINHNMKNKVNKDSRVLDINDFVHNVFIPAHHDTLVSRGLEVQPYKKYLQYKDAFENTLNYDGELTDFTYKERVQYKCKSLGKYVSPKGEVYEMEILTIEGKEYLIAKDEIDRYEASWCFYTAKKISKDYLEFMQKKGTTAYRSKLREGMIEAAKPPQIMKISSEDFDKVIKGDKVIKHDKEEKYTAVTDKTRINKQTNKQISDTIFRTPHVKKYTTRKTQNK